MLDEKGSLKPWVRQAGLASVGILFFLGLVLWLGNSGPGLRALAARVATVLGALVAAALAVLVLRMAFGSNDPNPAMPSGGAEDVNSTTRRQLATVVLAVGTAAIILMAAGLISAFTYLAYTKTAGVENKIDTLLNGVFAAVLPVFATWVGTILAFYFSNESFRQAAQAAREATAVKPAPLRVTDKWIIYGKIAKDEVKEADATAYRMSSVYPRFDSAITRFLLFTPEKRPIYILRKRLIPAAWAKTEPNGTMTPTDPDDGRTVKEYLSLGNGEVAKDATAFGFVSTSATLEEARAEMQRLNCKDLFVTQTGKGDREPVLGWVTDDQVLST